MIRLAIVILAVSGVCSAAISQLFCAATGAQAQIRQEGYTERLGDLVLRCNGDVPAGDVGVSISLFISAPVTNRITSDGLTDALLEMDAGPGTPLRTSRARLVAPNGLIFEPINMTLTPLAQANLRITNIRVNASGPERSVTATITSSGLSRIATTPNPVAIGLVRPGMLANSSTTTIFCQGSPLPEEEMYTFSNLIAAGTRHSTLRVTEGQPEGFQARMPGADTGTRVIVKYSGFPADARLFVPNMIAGSTAIRQTSTGALGVPLSGGVYSPGAGGLILLRVFAHDANGAGGRAANTLPLPGNPPVELEEVSEAVLNGGAATVVYEVFGSNPVVLESTHLPVFISLPANSPSQGTVARASLSLGPNSTVSAASETAPVPRFSGAAPGLDCPILTDCSANYFPRLSVESPALDFRVQLGISGFHTRTIRILNVQGGAMVWNVTIRYRNGDGWLKLVTRSGINNASINLEALADKVPATGLYEGTVTIDAGALAGTVTLPVSMTVTEAPPPPPVTPIITGAWNSAREALTALVPGSRATIRGSRLSGDNLRIDFDGMDARALSVTTDRIEVIVPPQLGVQTSAQLIVTAGGVASPPFRVNLVPAAPAIYPGGVFNADATQNTAAAPQVAGGVFQIFATGLPLDTLGRITAKIHDVEIEAPLYAGPAPSVPGVQQVNIPVADYFPDMSSEVLVCGWSANAPGTRVCSAPAVVWLKAR
jgi:uncharacterized protein (TIGR03437 family)